MSLAPSHAARWASLQWKLVVAARWRRCLRERHSALALVGKRVTLALLQRLTGPLFRGKRCRLPAKRDVEAAASRATGGRVERSHRIHKLQTLIGATAAWHFIGPP